jgi:hypothetical protein
MNPGKPNVFGDNDVRKQLLRWFDRTALNIHGSEDLLISPG